MGQNRWEEVDFAPASAGDGPGWNYGWNAMEGSHPYQGTPPPNAVGPLFDFSHDGGNCSVTGGYVYRGARFPALQGGYLYGDYCGGKVLAVRQQGGRVTEQAVLGLSVSGLSSFGEDQGGEVYALSLGGAVYRIDPA